VFPVGVGVANVRWPAAANRDGYRAMYAELFVCRGDVMSGPARVYTSVSAALCPPRCHCVPVLLLLVLFIG